MANTQQIERGQHDSLWLFILPEYSRLTKIICFAIWVIVHSRAQRVDRKTLVASSDSFDYQTCYATIMRYTTHTEFSFSFLPFKMTSKIENPYITKSQNFSKHIQNTLLSNVCWRPSGFSKTNRLSWTSYKWYQFLCNAQNATIRPTQLATIQSRKKLKLLLQCVVDRPSRPWFVTRIEDIR